MSIKFNVNTLSEEWLKSQRKVAERLATANPDHPDYKHARFILDSFKLKGAHGQHLCIVYDMLRGPICGTMEELSGHLFSSDDLRKFVPALFQGLDYMHTECHVIHTDLKPDNIMMGLSDPKILEQGVQDEAHPPRPAKCPTLMANHLPILLRFWCSTYRRRNYAC